MSQRNGVQPDSGKEYSTEHFESPLFIQKIKRFRNGRFKIPIVGDYFSDPRFLEDVIKFFYFAIWAISIILLGLQTNGGLLSRGTERESTLPAYYASCDQTLDTIESLNCTGGRKCDENLIVRCPAYCMNSIKPPKSKQVKNAADVKKPLVSGTQETGYYTGSHTCAAAIHAGVSGKYSGGCFKYKKLSGRAEKTVGSTENGIESVPLESSDGIGFNLYSFTREGVTSNCADLSLIGSVANGVFTLGLIVLNLSHLSSYLIASFGSFWTIVIFMGVRDTFWIYSSYTRCVTCLVYLYTVYKLFLEGSFGSLKSKPLCTAAFVLLLNLTIHIDIVGHRLGSFKIEEGRTIKGKETLNSVVLALIALGVIFVVVKESVALYKKNLIVKYLLAYILATTAVVLMPKAFGLRFRIHHWMIGLCLIPLIQSKDIVSSGILGIATGFFVHGIARHDLRPLAVE